MNQSAPYDEESLLPISALQHLMFCERQWALIHLEQIWEENVLTVKGRELHERVDASGVTTNGDIATTRSLRLRSLRLGLTGIADIVEFHGRGGQRHPYPVEYKRGKPKKDLIDIVQLCAQAFCLEEMFEIDVSRGALFYGETKRRQEIDFTEAVRQETLSLIKKLHQVTLLKKTPAAKYEKKCENCSLLNWCLPSCTDGSKRANEYVNSIEKWVKEDG